MPKDNSRLLRIGDQIQRELAVMIPREVKDPRLGFVTVTAVEVSRDLGHAKVFITLMSDDAEKIQQNLDILHDAAGLLRTRLGQSIKLRSLPQLHFHFDESIVRGAHLSALIERAVSEDKQHDNPENASGERA